MFNFTFASFVNRLRHARSYSSPFRQCLYLVLTCAFHVLFGICRSIVICIGLPSRTCCILLFRKRQWLPLLKSIICIVAYIVHAFATWGLIDPFEPIAPKTA